MSAHNILTFIRTHYRVNYFVNQFTTSKINSCLSIPSPRLSLVMTRFKTDLHAKQLTTRSRELTDWISEHSNLNQLLNIIIAGEIFGSFKSFGNLKKNKSQPDLAPWVWTVWFVEWVTSSHLVLIRTVVANYWFAAWVAVNPVPLPPLPRRAVPK